MEDELRELRLQLKVLLSTASTARSDVKRYANYALRVQQELAREQQRSSNQDDDKTEAEGRNLAEDARFSYMDDDGDDTSYSGTPRASIWEEKAESSAEIHDAWVHKIDGMLRSLDARQSSHGSRQAKESTRTHQDVSKEEDAWETALCGLRPFLQQQKLFIEDLGRENAKLRDMLHARPTRREFLSSHLEIERLQSQVHKLRVQTRTSVPLEASTEAGEDPARPKAGEAAGARDTSFSERVTEDKLLRSLYVETKTPWNHSQLPKERMTTGRSYLKEKVQCRLSLDSAALAAISSGRATASTPALGRSGSVEDEITQRVGRICSEIVANCCYVLDVKEIGKLPRYVEKVHRLAHLSSTYLAFVERLEKLLKQYNLNCFNATKVQPKTSPPCHEVLEGILAQVGDLLVELDARREQMRPPGSKAHEVLLESMRLLQVARIDELAPTIRRLIDSIRAEQTFQRDLRVLLHLDEAATRKQILSMASNVISGLGFSAESEPLPRSSAASFRYSHT